MIQDSIREAKNTYQREWRKNHPEQWKAIQDKYWHNKQIKKMKANRDSIVERYTEEAIEMFKRFGMEISEEQAREIATKRYDKEFDELVGE